MDSITGIGCWLCLKKSTLNFVKSSLIRTNCYQWRYRIKRLLVLEGLEEFGFVFWFLQLLCLFYFGAVKEISRSN